MAPLKETPKIRVLISCVTGEFGQYRQRLSEHFKAFKGRPIEVIVQEDFTQGGYTLLEKLDGYVRDCDLVIHLAGADDGAVPHPDHVRRFLEKTGRPILPSVPDRSYTQWEYHLALEQGKKVLVYLHESVGSGGGAVGCAPRQTAHVKLLRDSGQDRGRFKNFRELAKAVFYDLGLNPEKLKPVRLPLEPLGDLFKGRDGFLARIQGMFAGGGTPEAAAGEKSVTRSNVISAISVCGMGGVGKTRLAVEYAHRNREDYNALLFVQAESKERLQQSLADLCGALVVEDISPEEPDLRAKLEAVMRWLQNHPGWFLIIDNVDTDEVVTAVTEQLGLLAHAGHVLVTSRIPNWSAGVKALDLGVIETEAGAQYLLAATQERRSKSARDEALALVLAEELGGLALALEQAAAYIRERGLSFQDYWHDWRSHREEVLRWHKESVMRYPQPIATAWLTTFAKLDADGRFLLNRLAWVGPESIPEILLESWPQRVGPAPTGKHDAAAPTTRALKQALGQLRSYMLAQNEGEGCFRIHRLVQEITRGRLLAANDEHALSDAIGWISAAAGDPECEANWDALTQVAPHVLAVVRHGRESRSDDARLGELDKVLPRYKHAKRAAFCQRFVSFDYVRYISLASGLLLAGLAIFTEARLGWWESAVAASSAPTALTQGLKVSLVAMLIALGLAWFASGTVELRQWRHWLPSRHFKPPKTWELGLMGLTIALLVAGVVNAATIASLMLIYIAADFRFWRIRAKEIEPMAHDAECDAKADATLGREEKLAWLQGVALIRGFYAWENQRQRLRGLFAGYALAGAAAAAAFVTTLRVWAEPAVYVIIMLTILAGEVVLWRQRGRFYRGLARLALGAGEPASNV